MALKLYNTLTRTLEPFKEIKKGEVGIYACGPTVYNYVHIGNLRAYIFYDLVSKYLKYKGYKVKLVSNITDIDDKTIRDSQKNNQSLTEFTEKYTKAYIEDLTTLNIDLPDEMPKATDYINQMVDMTKKLLEKGHAYKAGSSIYFKIDSFNKYGQLAKLDNFDQLKKNAEGRLSDADEYEKDDVRDFALWKAYEETDGDVFWEPDIGKGRPGWHIECSVMSSDLLGPTFDMHLGGVDLIFPHHTNEIAQSEGTTGKKFVNYWLHNEHLLVEGKKMSKSLGNFYTLRDLEEKNHKPEAIRYLLLATHYRQKLNFTLKSLEAAQNSVDRLQDFYRNLTHIKATKNHPKVKPLIEKAKAEFEKKLDDDLNISEALAVIFDFMRDINKLELSKQNAEDIITVIKQFNTVIGVIQTEQDDLEPAFQELIDQREEARKNKNFEESDKIRNELKKKGILLDDTSEGVIWKRT